MRQLEADLEKKYKAMKDEEETDLVTAILNAASHR